VSRKSPNIAIEMPSPWNLRRALGWSKRLCDALYSSVTTLPRSLGPFQRPLHRLMHTGGQGHGAAAAASASGGQRPYTIVVEGNIGSGKTTFLQPFTQYNQVEVVEEPVARWRNLDTGNGQQNLLELMYEDPARWSLLFQTYVQLTMIQQHTRPATKPIRIMERSLARYCFVENLYSRGKMTDAEYAVLSQWFNFLVTCPQLDLKIDHIVYLRTDPEIAHERIRRRSRKEEHLIPFDYLTDLHNLHEDWLMKRSKFQPLPCEVTVIDANQELEVLQSKFQSLKDKLIRQAFVTSSAS